MAFQFEHRQAHADVKEAHAKGGENQASHALEEVQRSRMEGHKNASDQASAGSNAPTQEMPVPGRPRNTCRVSRFATEPRTAKQVRPSRIRVAAAPEPAPEPTTAPAPAL